jgi:predicted nucleotidyltransferase
VLNNVIDISSIIEELKELSDKIILFGSAKEGVNIKESDIDLFVITNSPEEVRKSVGENKRIQLIVKKPLEFVELKSKEPEFYDEVSRGIVLWEKTE